MMSQRHDSIIKVLVVGSHKSGKTSLIARLTANNLPEIYRPTVEQCSSTMTTLPDKSEKLMRFTELGPREEVLYSLYTKMNDIMVVTISQNQRESVYFALRILKNLLTHTMNEGANVCPILLVDTKADRSAVSVEQSEDLSRMYPLVITSALQSTGINEMRHKIVSMVLPELYKSKKKIKFFFAKATLVTKLIPSKAQKQEQSQRKTISKLEESILNFSLTPLATTQSPLGAPTNLALRKISDVTHNRCRLPTNLTRRGLQRRDSF